MSAVGQSRISRPRPQRVRFTPDSRRIAAWQQASGSGQTQTSVNKTPAHWPGLVPPELTRLRCRFSLPLPSPQAEQATTSNDQAGQASACDGAGDGARFGNETEVTEADGGNKLACYYIHTRIEEERRRTEVGISQGRVD